MNPIGENVAVISGGPSRHCQWSYFLRNPQGGGFGSNAGAGAPMRRAIAEAIQHLPVGTSYRLIVNDADRGVFVKE